jgi:hypothetical protein
VALATTTLSGAITQNQTTVNLTAFTNPVTSGIGPKCVLVVDGEAMLVTDASLSPTLQVVRGYQSPIAGQPGTPAFQHNILAPVVYGLTSDYTQSVGNPGGAQVYSYGASATVTNPVLDATIYIDKATAAALTLTDPAKDQRNTVRFISRTDAAHTITYATGFYGSTTGSDVATFPATLGAVFTIVAQNGQWCPVATADDGVTIA